MTTQEFAPESEGRRVVEAEIRLPRFSEIDLQPAKRVVGEVLLTSLGLGVLLTRAVARGIKNAHSTGREWAESSEGAGHTLTGWIDGKPVKAADKAPFAVPVLPIADYDDLPPVEIAAALVGLDAEAIAVVREYEVQHGNRQTVLSAIDNRLAMMS